MQIHSLLSFSSLTPLQPAYALAANVDLVVLRLADDDPEQVVVMYGRYQHRGALMSDAHIQDDKIVCGLHGSHYIYKTGINPRYLNKNLQKFKAWVEDDQVMVDLEEISAWEKRIHSALTANVTKVYMPTHSLHLKSRIMVLF